MNFIPETAIWSYQAVHRFPAQRQLGHEQIQGHISL